MIWPKYRTADYLLWGCCIRVGVRPPGIPALWDEMTAWQQAQVIAFHQIASYDEELEKAKWHNAAIAAGVR